MCCNPQPHEPEDCEPRVFVIGDKIVYPGHGVAVLERVEVPRDVPEVGKCYFLRLANGCPLMVPVPNAERLRLRSLSTRAEIEELFQLLRQKPLERLMYGKGRYEEALAMMRSGSLTDAAEVFKSLHPPLRRRGLLENDKRLYDRSRQFLIVEVAAVKNISEKEAEKQICDCIQQALVSAA